MNQLVSPPIALGPSGASPNGGFQNYAPPVIQAAVAPVNGVLQVETATAAGTISGTGNVVATVTSSLFAAPVVVQVPVVDTDTAAVVGGKIRAAFGSVKEITDHYTVSGATTATILTVKKAAPNDTSLNIALANGTSAGLTAAPNSANTTAGVAGTPGAIGQELVIPNGTFYKLKVLNPPTWGTITVS